MLSVKLEECGRVFSYRDDPDNTCEDVTICTTILLGFSANVVR